MENFERQIRNCLAIALKEICELPDRWEAKARAWNSFVLEYNSFLAAKAIDPAIPEMEIIGKLHDVRQLTGLAKGFVLITDLRK